MNGNSTLTITMLPSGSNFQQQPKRKADDSSNPLLAAAKRLKKDKTTATKRKLLNAEETPTGLFIVRAPPTQDSSFSASQPLPSSSHTQTHVPPRASSSQPMSRTSSSTPSSSASSSQPPTKKFRASSQPLYTSSSRHHTTHSPIPEDPELETAVQAMNDEVDHLRSRGHSRVPTVMDQNMDPAFQFSRIESGTTGKKGKGKEREIVMDTSLPVEQNETPQIQRNKKLREGAMAAIASEREENGDERVGRAQQRGMGHRRKSSLSRGKRISSGYETTGIITSPHNSVSETSFYKHIDCDLPDSERLRQLLIWCTIRASGTTTFTSSSTPSKPKSVPPNPKLPKLSAKATEVLKRVQDDVVRMLAERKVDLSLYGGSAESSQSSGTGEGSKLKENEQNLKNKDFEVKYSQQIRQLEGEEDQWKKVAYRYEEYTKRFTAAMDKRVEEANSWSLSAKAKGKRRQIETEEEFEEMLPDPHDLAPNLRKSLDLARSALAPSFTTSTSSSSSSQKPTTILTTLRGTNMTRSEITSTINTLIQDVNYKLDRLHSFVSAARTTTRIAEQMLDERFRLLVDNLEKRRLGSQELEGGSTERGDGGVAVVRNYVRKEAAASSSIHHQGPGASTTGGGGLMDLMRALSRIDTARHPSKIGDSVRRAAREVKRIGETGGGVGDRRLTAVYPPGILSGGGNGNGGSVVMTPRKAPGTPRRHGTPGRDRERTPGR